jgi:hypothetical protein
MGILIYNVFNQEIRTDGCQYKGEIRKLIFREILFQSHKNKFNTMKKYFKFFSVIFAFFCMLSSYAQTAEDIVSKHIENTGGREKSNSVTSMIMNYSLNVMGTDAPATATLLVGKGYKNELDFNGQKIVEVITDKGGWTVNPMAGITAAQAIPDQQFIQSKNQLDFAPFIDYMAKGSKLELVGKERMDNEDVFKLYLTTKDNVVITYYFSATTFYLLKAVQKLDVMGQQLEIANTFSNFRKTDYGLVMPFAFKIEYGQIIMTAAVNSIEFNKPVDPVIFEMKK